jgi:23S rRNA pseudouridine1911/1915/1917 synthase
MTTPTQQFRLILVPDECDGLRLDRFLKKRFAERSRNWLTEGIRMGQVRDNKELALRPATRVHGGQALHLYLPGIAPTGPEPKFPEVLFEDARIIVVNKPAGLLCHPAGTNFTWAVISLAKQKWPDHRIDLAHRLDRDTSGTLMLTKDTDANRFMKEALKGHRVHKVYQALCQGHIPWDKQSFTGAIGSDGGIIRIKMAERADGLAAHTDVEVIARTDTMSQVRCVLHTGRTHQIRVHLATAGFPLVGDRMYGVEPEVFLHTLDHGGDAWVRVQAGAPHHALHAETLSFPHPDGGQITVECPLPDALQRWWDHPEVLPHDGH